MAAARSTRSKSTNAPAPAVADDAEPGVGGAGVPGGAAEGEEGAGAAAAVGAPDDGAKDPLLRSEIGAIAGHGLVKALLGSLLRTNALPQVLLFHGSPGIGKRTLAVCLAKRLLSPDPAPGPADELRASPDVSRRVARLSHLDFYWVRAEGTSRVLRIDQIRALQEWAWTAPSEGKRKVALVFGAEAITEEGANSLLKLLEEPPSRLTIVLTTDSLARMLETVRSRCSLVAMHPLPASELSTWLVRTAMLPRETADLLAQIAEGRPGRALALLSEKGLASRRPLFDELMLLTRSGFLVLPGVSARMMQHAGGLRPALEGLLLLLRDALALGATVRAEGAAAGDSADAMALQRDLAAPLREFAQRTGSAGLLAACEAIGRGIDITRHLYIPSELLVMENVLADVGKALRRPAK